MTMKNTIVGGIFTVLAAVIGAYASYYFTSKQYDNLIDSEYVKRNELENRISDSKREIESKFKEEIERNKFTIEDYTQQTDSLKQVIKSTFVDTIDGTVRLSKVLKKDIKIPTGNGSFSLKLTTLEFMDSGNVRYNIEFRNKANKSQLYTLLYPKCYLSDEHGNRYGLKAVSSNKSLGDVYSHELPGGLKANHWLEFGPPKDNATKFKLHLSRTPYVGNKVTYSSVNVSIDESIK